MTQELILSMIEQHQFKELKIQLEMIHPVDLAELFSVLDFKSLVLVFRLLSKPEAAETFAYMNNDMQEQLLTTISEGEIRDIMEELYLDDTVDILEEMPANVVKQLLAIADHDTRARINELLEYPEDSAGSIMTVEYIALSQEMTVAESILKIRKTGLNKETIYTCYVIDKRKLIGSVLLKDLLGSNDGEVIHEIMDKSIISVRTGDDQEDVAKLTRKYGLLAVPVVDHEDCLVGIVTVDDVMNVLEDETTEDINIMAAMLPVDDRYFEVSVWRHAGNRIPWLLFLMLSATVTGVMLNQYEAIIAMVPLLVSFIPMLMDTGGNCGAQSSSLIIRGLAVDEIHFPDIGRVLFKEIRVALMIGVLLAIINGLKIYLMYHDGLLALSLGVTLVFTILMAKIVGGLLPLLATKIKLDPAIMAAPLITTIVDTGSIFIYFTIVSYLLL